MMMDKCSWNDKSPRYIDADRLIKDLQSSAVKNADNKQYAKGATDGVQLFAVDVVNRAPTVEAQEVRHGRWELDEIIGGMQDYKCSVCGAVISETFMMQYNGCPYCLAKMDGGDKE